MSESKSKLERAKALPWFAIVQAALVVHRRWRGLSKRERAHLSQLLRDSRGWPGNLTSKQRAELRKLLGKLDLRSSARELLLLRRRARRRGRR